MRKDADLLPFFAVLPVVEAQVAGRAGVTRGSLRVLARIAALTDTGVTTRAADVVAAKAAAPNETRLNLRRLLASGHLERHGGPVAGRLHLTLAGRKVLAELLRGWERARRSLMSFQPCPPFRRTTPRKARGLELPSNDSGNDGGSVF